MAFQGQSTNFINRDADTPIVAEWLNDVDRVVYKPSLKTNIGGVVVPNFSIDHSTPNARVEIDNTNPMDWAGGPGKMTVDFQVTPNSYFAANPSGHFAIVLRCDTSVIATAVRGQGMAIGDLTGAVLPSDLKPSSTLETWMNSIAGAPAGNMTFGGASESAISLGWKDGTTYRVIIEATCTVDGNRYLRYRSWVQQAVNLNWLPYVDTGDVLDHNVWADLTHSGLVFGQVFESNFVPWSLAITNCVVTWGPADLAVPDITTKLSKYGAEMQGNISFDSASRTLIPYDDAGPSLKAWTAVQTRLVDSTSTLLVKPSGTATSANFGAVDTSNPDTVYRLVTYGIKAGRATIETVVRGTTGSPLDVIIDAATAATFTPSGVTLPASRAFQPTTDTGPSLAAWAAVKDPTTDYPTTLLAKPNGVSTVANFGAVNTSNPDTVYGLVTFGMAGTNAKIETIARGTAVPQLRMNINAITVATFNASGMMLAAASKTIGEISSIYANLLNVGGANARAYANSGSNTDIESICTPGTIATTLGGTYSAANIETVLRGLWCLTSTLIDEVRTLRKML